MKKVPPSSGIVIIGGKGNSIVGNEIRGFENGIVATNSSDNLIADNVIFSREESDHIQLLLQSEEAKELLQFLHLSDETPRRSVAAAIEEIGHATIEVEREKIAVKHGLMTYIHNGASIATVIDVLSKIANSEFAKAFISVLSK